MKQSRTFACLLASLLFLGGVQSALAQSVGNKAQSTAPNRFTAQDSRTAAENSAPEESSLPQGIVTQLLDEGVQLELNHRWQEAIHHYEKAIRSVEEQSDLQRRLQISRIHYDVVRRYTDSTFTHAIGITTPSRSLDLYSEVLQKLEMNYVEPIILERLVRNGTAFLEVALTESDFIKANLANADAAAIDQFRLTIHKSVLGKTISTPLEARMLVASVAEQAEREIGLMPSATIHEYVSGAVGLLDPYSGYMTAGELSDVMSQIEGNLIGLGIELWAEGDELRIVEVFANGPAFEAGLASGDHILAVDGNVVSDISAKRAADMLRGPANSAVRLSLLRANGDRDTIDIRRRRVEVPSVTGIDIVDANAGVGYIRITNFQKTTSNEVDSALMALSQRNLRSLIIDLRRNPGGLLDASVDIANRFIRAGGIVSTRGRSGIENKNFLATAESTLDIPLVILIDEDSASASEILAGAIHDHKRGVLVGHNSYGKGSVQGLYRTETTAGGIRLTVSKFYSPSGAAISMRGVQPDVVIHEIPQDTYTSAKPPMGNDGEKLIQFRTKSQDLALRRAIEVAREATKVATR
jgi:carboxyl-terminal processing protease